MPKAPIVDPATLQQSGMGAPADPLNFLLATADLHSKGEFQSAPVPEGKPLQTGRRPPSGRHKIRVVR